MCLNYDTEMVDGENLTVPQAFGTSRMRSGMERSHSFTRNKQSDAFMTATVDYFANDEDNQTGWTNGGLLSANDATITAGWSEAYETHYTGGYGEYTEGYVGDAHMVVSYCHSPESNHGNR